LKKKVYSDKGEYGFLNDLLKIKNN